MNTETVSTEQTSVRQINWMKVAIPVGITIATLIGLSMAIDIRELETVLRKTNIWLVLLAALKVPVQVLFWTLRWYLIIRARDFSVGFNTVSIAVLVRSFFNNMTPGAGTGGEPIGAYYLSKNSSMSFKQAMASTASERMCQGMVFVGIIVVTFLIIIPLLPVSSTFIRPVLIGLGIFCSFVVLMLYLSIFQFKYGRSVLITVIRLIAWLIPPFRKRWDLENLPAHLDEWHHEFKAFTINIRVIIWVIIFTTLNWVLDVLQPYFLFKALHVDVPLWLIVMNATLVRITGIFSIIPGGAGLLEGLNVVLYAGLSSVPREAIVAETILFRALDAWILWLVSGLVSSFALTSLTKINQKKAA